MMYFLSKLKMKITFYWQILFVLDMIIFIVPFKNKLSEGKDQWLFTKTLPEFTVHYSPQSLQYKTLLKSLQYVPLLRVNNTWLSSEFTVHDSPQSLQYMTLLKSLQYMTLLRVYSTWLSSEFTVQDPLLQRTLKNYALWKKISKCVKFGTKSTHFEKKYFFFKVR